MPDLQIHIKVVVELTEGEQPQRIARELARAVKKVYGVRETEVTSIIADEE